MTVQEHPPTVQAATKEDIKVRIRADVRRVVDPYIARQNAINAPYKISIASLVNAAVLEYIARREEAQERAA